MGAIQGLSSAQIWAEATSVPATVRYHKHGRLTKISFQEDSDNAQGGGIRRACNGFSKRSRKHLLEKLNSLNRYRIRRLPYFVTLTYPSSWPSDPRVWKEHLHNWRRMIDRALGKTCFIWKLELQKRGAPHFHLMMFADYEVRDLYKLMSDSWYEAVGSGDEAHRRAGTSIEPVKSWRGVISYAAKYIGKVDDAPATNMGRIWGIYGRSELPVDPVELGMLYEHAMYVRRTLRRYRGLSGDSHALGTSAFLGDEPILALLCYLGYSVGPPDEPPPTYQPEPSERLRSDPDAPKKTLHQRGYRVGTSGRYYRAFQKAKR